jgi:deoxyribose-phosphate aldolase
MHRIINAGLTKALCWAASAARASLIDHTWPEANEADINVFEEAASYRFALLRQSSVGARLRVICGVGRACLYSDGFPLGATLPDVKAYEARRAIFDGAREVDMVINMAL